uniref:Uncharacterized protein n=1 Tax=Tanacetum cinerariifolium TaxID=118510 RepID=A0A699I1K6_TANCI|nr:hypothetical protein [Tanacetum cinerariifolium]
MHGSYDNAGCSTICWDGLSQSATNDMPSLSRCGVRLRGCNHHGFEHHQAQEIPLGGCSFTWCHRFAKKMSKLDRFLMSEGLLGVNPNFSALTLDRMYHYWFEIDAFEEMILKAWCECPIVEVNPMLYLMYKMKFLKKCIREWNGKRQSNKCKKGAFKKDLHDLEIVIEQVNATDDILYKIIESLKTFKKRRMGDRRRREYKVLSWDFK